MRVVTGAPQSALVTDKDLIPIQIELAEADEIGTYLDRDRWREALLLAVNAVLDPRSAGRLEDAGISYVDAAGHFWHPGSDRTELKQERAGRQPGRRLYPPSIRLAQLLADHPAEPWSERGLAACGRTTPATAHKLFVRLEREGIIGREGQGRGAFRQVEDVLAMRRWLAREGRPRRVTSLTCYLRDPLRLPDLPGRSFALTGAAGAAALGLTVTTDQPTPVLRVNVNDDELEDLPEALGGFRTAEGANLVLIADPDRLAFVDREAASEGHFTAPPSRVLLDLYLESRGEATADVFLSLWGDRELAR